MPKISMWWLFLTLFGLTIGGIQTLGWWTKPASAYTQAPTSQATAEATAAAARHQNGEPRHWRSMVMQQQ